MPKKERTPNILIILDGWGIGPSSSSNAISQAKKPFFNQLVSQFPVFSLQASGEVVGLTWGEMGNSEVGHLSIGSGRIVYQSLARINKSIIDKSFFNNETLLKSINHAQKNNSALHLIGLISNGGVHSNQDHLYALLDLCKQKSIKNVYIHAILDGRDTLKDEGLNFIKELESKLKEVGIGKIATISGRFFAMDRDNHWDRTEKAFRVMAEGKSEKIFNNAALAITDSYKNNIFDEMFVPVALTDGKYPIETIKENDAVIFFNFRADRARQLTSSFIIPGFEKFSRKKYFKNLFFATFTQYDKNFPVEIVFPPVKTTNTFADVLSENNYTQLRMAETEKYAHVTFFFNGGLENPVKNEDRILIPSPVVITYDQKPEMSAYELTNRVLKEISKNFYDFIILNFANADMVGHTGNLPATIKAVQVIDECLDKIINAIWQKDGIAFITADHGNAEAKIELETGKVLKEHSKNPVPFIIAGKKWVGQSTISTNGNIDDSLYNQTSSGILADVSPTILKLLNLPIPKDMTGSPLL